MTTIKGLQLALCYVLVLAGLCGYVHPAFAGFKFFAKHPYASKQPTSTGRTINSLQAYGGGIYAGYGDGNKNTGPIRLCKLDPSSAKFSCEFTQYAEAIARFRVNNGKLYSISLDPGGGKNSLDAHAYAVKSAGTWESKTVYQVSGSSQNYPVHFYDIIHYHNKLWLFSDYWAESSSQNSSTQSPLVSKSNISGTSWSMELYLPQLGTQTASVFCYGGLLNGRIYVQAADLGCRAIEQVSRVYDGNRWTTGPSMMPGVYSSRKSGNFAGHLIMIHGGLLHGFDGQSYGQKYSVPIFDYTINGAYLYILTRTGKVCRTKNLSDYSCFEDAPLTARSIELLDNIIYIGITSGEIYKSTVLAAKTRATIQILTTLLLDSPDEADGN